jgi:hypothetical protein
MPEFAAWLELSCTIEQQRKSSVSQISQFDGRLELSRANSLVKSQGRISTTSRSRSRTRQADEFALTQGLMAMAEVDDVKQDIEEKIEEIREFNGQLERLGGHSHNLDEMRSTYLKQFEAPRKRSGGAESENAQLVRRSRGCS